MARGALPPSKPATCQWHGERLQQKLLLLALALQGGAALLAAVPMLAKRP